MNLLSEALRHIALSMPDDLRWTSRKRMIQEIAGKVDHLDEPMDDQVADFHRKFGHDAPVVPVLPEIATMEFRIKLIEEETRELVEAIRARKLGPIIQECVDLVYVVLGTLVVCGVRIKPFFSAVHEANMAKEPNPKGGKPIKPEGWEKPDCSALIKGPIFDREPGWPVDRSCDDGIGVGEEVL